MNSFQELHRHDVIRALELLLNDSKFLTSPKTSSFIEYVVLQTLDGHEKKLDGHSIAVSALKKSVTFDEKLDPTVRIMARRARELLCEYYCQTGDHNIIIRINPGSYIPQIFVSTNDSLRYEDTENCS